MNNFLGYEDFVDIFGGNHKIGFTGVWPHKVIDETLFQKIMSQVSQNYISDVNSLIICLAEKSLLH